MDIQSAERLYSEMGEVFSHLDKWQIYVLTSDEAFERYFGRRADKVRRLYNGMLKCNYYQFFKQSEQGVSERGERGNFPKKAVRKADYK